LQLNKTSVTLNFNKINLNVPMKKRLILQTIALITLHYKALGTAQENLPETTRTAQDKSPVAKPFSEWCVNQNTSPTLSEHLEESFDDLQKQQIINVLSKYEMKIGTITEPLISACIEISTDVINLYMEYALRLHTQEQTICQLDLVKIFAQFRIIDDRSLTSLSRVLGILSRVYYREDEGKIELLELMSTPKRQINNDDFFERLSYIENFPNESEYLDFQFVCNMLICDSTTVKAVMQQVSSNHFIKNE
jgi:hypothetical protein